MAAMTSVSQCPTADICSTDMPLHNSIEKSSGQQVQYSVASTSTSTGSWGLSTSTSTSTRTWGSVASPGFCVRGHRFGVVKRPKIKKMYVVPPQAALYTPEYALLH